MAGRAGRPQFGTDGYSFILTKTKKDEMIANEHYFKGKLERAISHISEDAYFRKAILELIYSDRGRTEEIISFFEKTFYNYQSQREDSPFSTFDLSNIIRNHVIYLEDNDFLEYLGIGGYQLTKLGTVTLDFLFNTFYTYDLDVFLLLEKYIDEMAELKAGYDIIYLISKIFAGARLVKIPRKRHAGIEAFYEQLSIDPVSHAEYSAYVICRYWIENWPVEAIEDTFHVYCSPIEQVVRELHALLSFSEKLAEIKTVPVSNEFSDFKQRIRRGYRKEELPFSTLRGFGRILLRKIHNHCHEKLTKHPWNYSGTTLEILIQAKASNSKDKFVEILSSVDGISEIRATRIYDFIE